MDSIVKFLDSYSIIIANNQFNPVEFFINICFITLIFIIRVAMLLNIENKKNIKYKKISIINNQLICYLFALVVSFILTTIGNNPSNHFFNCLVCPISAFISSLWFDSSFLSKFNNKKESKNDNGNIVINVNDKKNKCESIEDTDGGSLDDILKTKPSEMYISSEDIEDPEKSDEILRKNVNTLISYQYIEAKELKSQSCMLKKQSEEMNTQSNMLISIRDTMMTDKKFKLESMIYECLNQGYATPEQNKRITADYKNYRSLGGNGEIKELYEKHYLNLKIHDNL